MFEYSISPLIFRDYDIRGQVGKYLTPQVAHLVGRAFGTILRRENAHSVCVARDGRLSSLDLEKSLIQGLVMSGLHVTSLGLGPTPFLYWSEHFLKTDAGVMITGSHNPPDENGFKLTLRTKPFFGPQITRIFNLIEAEDFIEDAGRLETANLLESYRTYLLDRLLWGERSLVVAWDPGHGAAGSILSELLNNLPGIHFIIHGNVDGRFPSRSPDPGIPEHLTKLRDLVLSKGCDVGLAFDGDGDRLVVMDNEGHVWSGDEVLALLTQNMLQRIPGAKIIADVKCSQILLDQIKDLSGHPILSKTGHVHMKNVMEKEEALLGGEMSGHFFFRDKHFGFDDGIYSALRFITLMSHFQGEALSECLKKFPTRYSTPEMRIVCPEDKKFKIVESLQKNFKEKNIPFNDLDGLRVDEKEGWWVLRASQTQAILVARCESTTPEGLETIKKTVSKLLKPYKIDLP